MPQCLQQKHPADQRHAIIFTGDVPTTNGGTDPAIRGDLRARAFPFWRASLLSPTFPMPSRPDARTRPRYPFNTHGRRRTRDEAWSSTRPFSTFFSAVSGEVYAQVVSRGENELKILLSRITAEYFQ